MKAKIIMEFYPGGSTKIVTVQGLTNPTQCKATADKLAALNGVIDESSRANTVDTFSGVMQTENEVKIQS